MAMDLKRLIEPLRDRLPGLKPAGIWNVELDRQIENAPLHTFGHEAGAQRVYALAVKSGLHLWNDSLDRSHALSQDIHNPTGSYWHGIMHRMEGDYGNAKYWFRQVGRHEVFAEVRERAERAYREWQAEEGNGVRSAADIEALVAGNVWDPYRMIDAVEEQVRVARIPEWTTLLLRIQRQEFAALLAYCYVQSGGGSPLELV